MKQSLIKVLLIINLVIGICTAAGVGYLAYKQNACPGFSEMGPGGNGQMIRADGQIQQNQTQ
ncbi:hypothetical protein [Metabacillus fastidiosus]|uniref:Uncharacterized protein n=1 Tax=Metabacillus fastidiosus TaxID=1458 RepID=A0ABU6P2S7_9BACI|nr:hypothetical protein [Metabacillus fastidiosus]MED4403665.1 hypothetical protein [Metabacillus fastidiosus]MED4463609.1 hypothetical protein [Metabacillus fastidiosus]